VLRASDSPSKPRVGITIGDPAGIGPEIVLKSVAEAEVRQSCDPVIIGSAELLRRQAGLLDLDCDYPAVQTELPASSSEYPAVFDTGDPGDTRWGSLSAASGRISIAAIEAAVKLCLSRRIDAIATAPINKESLKLAGSPYPGHTEMLAALCESDKRPLMCFFAGEVKIFLLTIHTSLREAIAAIRKDLVLESLIEANRELIRLGIERPRIAVAGLNPHAGENGLFGNEELREIAPAIADCRSRHGIDVSGPFPADTIFVRAWRGEFDAVAACYHDQGLIAAKCLAFGKAVNVTLGLPIIRTSVDHGTAFDIAGRGVAEHQSMVEAIKLAARLAQNKRDINTKENAR
jgi:4-hydroxythreonine-4-phosphate dehydrogenase